MYIKRLTLENFRGFDSFSIEFGSNCTILIGKNGSGKFNVLDGLVYALSFPFAKIKKIGSLFSIANSLTIQPAISLACKTNGSYRPLIQLINPFQ
jgi:predicted ATP-dependent endonuclease of OLD family